MDENIPNKETIAAMDEAEEMREVDRLHAFFNHKDTLWEKIKFIIWMNWMDFWRNDRFERIRAICIMRFLGFKPLFYTKMIFEHTFIFRTQREADIAGDLFETKHYIIPAWWYGLNEFDKGYADYCAYMKYTPKIIDLHKWSNVIKLTEPHVHCVGSMISFIEMEDES